MHLPTPARIHTFCHAGFVARDIHHATSVCRNFYWSLLNLWPDQLPEHTLVVLSGRDELVPVAEVIRMLEEESSAHLLYHDHHCHAEFIKDLKWQVGSKCSCVNKNIRFLHSSWKQCPLPVLHGLKITGV